MNTIKRDTSLITNRNNLEPLYKLKSFPVFIGCTDQPASEDIYMDMNWMICKDSGMIQLRDLLPLDLVYSEYHSEAQGPTWEAHHIQFCDFIEKHRLKEMLEIGGSNAMLAKQFLRKYKLETLWTIVEPNPGFEGNEKIRVYKSFFDESFTISGYDTIIHSHVLEHLYEPVTFLRHINNKLPAGGKHIFSIPNLYVYLKSKFSNAINFEHTYFLTEYFTDYLLTNNGFLIKEKQYFGEHSIFYSTEKMSSSGKIPLENHYLEYKNMYLEMISYYKDVVNEFNKLIENFKGSIYIFGAHIFTQFLVNQGLNSRKILRIIDNSKTKQGKRLYGTNLKVSAPEIIKENENTAVILKAGQYQDEVTKQLKEINPLVTIWS